MNALLVTAIGAVYLYLLFAVAYLIDRRARRGAPAAWQGQWVYALSIAVYCTSWTFYGSVGRSAASGIGFLPIYLGPVLVFVLGQPLLRKILRVAKSQHITTIADFISARYGKDPLLAGVVTVIAVVGIMPYISLQLKAVTTSFGLLLAYPAVGQPAAVPPPIYADTALYVTLAMSLFVIVFGTRQVDATEQHRGMVGAVALESLVKLAAFLAVGVFVVWGLFDGLGDLFGQAAAQERLAPLLDVGAALGSGQFWALTVLSMAAIVCLPRQFQVTVVENTDEADLRRAAWLFPLYLLAINLFVLPIALAGLLSFAPGSVNADTFVLSLPIAAGQPALAVVAFIGGLSAATGMIIVETIALATMVCNDLVLPLTMRRAAIHGRSDLTGRVKLIRRCAIVLVLLLGYAYVRGVGESRALVSIGLVSFAAAAQFAPAMLLGLYWKGGSRQGALAGLLAGFAVWAYTLLLPAFARSGWIDAGFVLHGPFGIAWLRPEAMLGMVGYDEIGHSLFWSMVANVGVYILVSLRSEPDIVERTQARAFVEVFERPATGLVRTWQAEMQVGGLVALASRFIDERHVRQAFAQHATQRGRSLDDTQRADLETVNFCERLLAGAIGSALARVVVASAIQEKQVSLEGVIEMLSDASQAIQTNWERLQETVENVSQGISMFDADYRLVVCNRQLAELLDMPTQLCTVGTRLEDMLRYNAQRGEYGPGDAERLVAERMALAARQVPHVFERPGPAGRVLEVRGKPLPGGGFVSTTTDITERKRAEQALRQAYDELELRVAQRTEELQAGRERFRGFAESASDWFWETDAQHRLRYVSERFLEATGLAPARVIGHSFWELGSSGGSEALWQAAQQTMHRHEAFRGLELPLTAQDGGVLQLRVTGQPWHDSAGVFCGFRGTGSDVTQLVQAQAELLRAERLAALGGLVAGVAHEINTPVGIGLTAASYLEELFKNFEQQYADGQLRRSDVEALLRGGTEASGSIIANLRRAADLVRSFKLVAVDQSSEQRRTFNLRGYVDEILRSLHPKLKRVPHRIEIDCASDIELNSYPGAFSQVLTNLIMNSLIHGFEADRPGLIQIGARVADGRLLLTYRDDGKGMSAEHTRHMFEPFFTTRRGQGGSGLGLHVVYNLVTQTLGGRIEGSSGPGQGVSYRIDVPFAAPEGPHERAA